MMRNILLMLALSGLLISAFAVGESEGFEKREVATYAPPPEGYMHRPLIEFFTGLSCPACMGSDPNDNSPEKAVHDTWLDGEADPSAPYSTVVFHELNGGGVDDLNTDEATDRMRYYQPGLSGTPDVQFDGGYIEIGGFSASNKPIDKPTVDWAISTSATRDSDAPIRPLERLQWNFPYVMMEVDQIFDGSSYYVEVKATYEANAKAVGGNLIPLQGSLYVFMVEDNVTAYSKVYDMNVSNDAVFRGYAAEDERFTLSQGQEKIFSLTYDIPNAKVPIKAQDMYAVAAIFDTQDTDSSPGGTDGNQRAGSPRSVQSATSRSTAYDRENEIPKVLGVELTGSTVTVTFDDEGGISKGYVFINTEDPAIPSWTPVELTISGEELCDEETGVCYAYSDASGTAEIDYSGGPLYAQVLIYDDESAQASSQVYSLVEASSGTSDKGGANFAFSGSSTLLIIGIVLVILGPALFIATKKAKGGLRIFRNKGVLSVFVILGLLMTMFSVYGMLAGSTDTVPDFSVRDTQGTLRTPATYEDKVLVIDIMSTDCQPCNEEMPMLVEMYKEVREKYGSEVEFLTVSISSQDTDQMLRDFQSKYGATWPIGQEPEFVTLFDAKFTPTMVIVSPSGELTYRHVGIVDRDEVLEEIDKAHSGDYNSISIRSSNSNLLFLGLFAGVLGAVTFFSPCSFPMLPGYFSFYLSTDSKGGNAGKKMNPLFGGTMAAAGIVTFYLIIGLVVWFISLLISSRSWTNVMYAVLTPLIGILMIIFGLLMFMGKDAFLERFIEGFKSMFSRLLRRKGSQQNEAKGGAGGLYIYGFGYGAASASCMAPIFITVLFLGIDGGILGAPVVFIVYSLALGGMMVLFSNLAASGSSVINKFISSGDTIKKVTAGLLVVAGIFVLIYNFFLEEYFTGLFNF